MHSDARRVADEVAAAVQGRGAAEQGTLASYKEGGLAFGCGHVACLPCAQDYFRHAIANGRLPITW